MELMKYLPTLVRRVCSVDKTDPLSRTDRKLIKAVKLIKVSFVQFYMWFAHQTWLTAHNKFGTNLAKSCGRFLGCAT